MRRFNLIRDEDIHDMSGTGKVAEGVVFSNGRVAMTWLTPYTSVTFFDNIDTVETLHGHNGRTRIQFYAEDKKKQEIDEDTNSGEL